MDKGFEAIDKALSVKAEIVKEKPKIQKQVQDDPTKEAITNWSIEQIGPIHTLIRLKIDTGRRAQIRLHMSDISEAFRPRNA